MTPADYDRLLTVIRALLDRQTRVIAAIDGRCGAGKSTLAAQLQAQLSCRVFHMDDFFLRPEQRTAARLAQPGENVDHERFLSEVLKPAQRGEAVVYRPFRCARQALDEPVTVPAARLTIVEGAYACHPALWDSYDLRVFLTVDAAEQLRHRNAGPLEHRLSEPRLQTPGKQLLRRELREPFAPLPQKRRQGLRRIVPEEVKPSLIHI